MVIRTDTQIDPDNLQDLKATLNHVVVVVERIACDGASQSRHFAIRSMVELSVSKAKEVPRVVVKPTSAEAAHRLLGRAEVLLDQRELFLRLSV